MSSKSKDMSAMDFVLFMNRPDSKELICQEFNIIELNRASVDEPEDIEETGCLQFLWCFKQNQSYLGAKFIDGYNAYDGQQRYVCLKNPKEQELEQFWELVHRHQVAEIAMMSTEGLQYWSPTEGTELQCGEFRIETLRIVTRPRFVLTILRLTDQGGRQRQISHFWYSNEAPREDLLAFLTFVCSLNDRHKSSKNKTPVIVHSDDGVNVEAFCVLDSCVDQVRYSGEVSVAEALRRIRQERNSCLDTFEDFLFCYEAVYVYVAGELGMTQRYLDEREVNRIDELGTFARTFETMESLVIGEFLGTADRAGNNFLHEICREGCLGLLLRAGFWLDKANEDLLQDYNDEGNQCVHIIARNHRGPKAVRLMEELVELGADINAPDRTSGATVLHLAVLHQDYQLVDWICRQDTVDLNVPDYAGMTAFQIAWKRRDSKMVDLLWEFGADGDQPQESDSEDAASDDES